MVSFADAYARNDFHAGMERVQDALSEMTDVEDYVPVVLRLRDDHAFEVWTGRIEERESCPERMRAMIEQSWKTHGNDPHHPCVFCTVNDEHLLVVPVGTDIPIN